MNESTTELKSARVNISLSESAAASLDLVASTFPFKEKLAITQLAVAYAIRESILPVRDGTFAKPAGIQNMNVGSFDPSNELRTLLRVLYPEQGDPAYVAETLMNLGLIRLEADLKAGKVSRLSDLTFTQTDPADGSAPS